MNVRIEIIDGKDALLYPGFVMPEVAENKEFGKFLHYAAFVDDRLCGILVCDPRIHEPEILSIGVSSEYTGKGIATALLKYAACDMLKEYDESEHYANNRFIARVLGNVGELDAIKKVFEKSGFVVGGEGVFYETKVGDIDNNRHIQNPNVITKVQKKSGRETFRSLKNTNRSLINVFGNRLARNRSFPGIFPDELDEDLTTFGIEKGRITSCMLFSKEADGIVRNRFLYREKTNRRDGMSLLKLLTRVSTVALEKLSPSTRLSFFTGNGNTKAIVLKIFPDAVPMQEYIVYELPFSELRSNAE